MNNTVLRLIDIMKDLNKSISMHIDNHGTPGVDKMIHDVGREISDSLCELEQECKNTQKGELCHNHHQHYVS